MIDTQAIRSKILDLAMRGKLTEQLPEDGTAEELYRQIRAEKQKRIKEGKGKKDKPLPGIGEAEIPFAIPANWKWIRFSELGVFCGGKTPSMANKAYWKNGSINWVTSKDMKQKYIAASEMMITEEASHELNLLPAHTVVFVVRSGILRRLFPVAILSAEGTINQDLKALQLFIPEMCEFVYCLLKCFESTILFKYTKDGTTVNNIVFDELMTMPLPLPPLDEQQRIVERVGQAFSSLDTIDALQSQYTDNLAALKSKLIEAAIQGKLTEQLPEDGTAEDLYRQIQAEKQSLIKAGKIKKEKPLSAITEDETPFTIPESWEWVRLGMILLVQPSNGFSPHAVNHQTPYKNLTLTATTSGFFKPNAFKYVSISQDIADKYYLENDDILVQRANARNLVGTSCIYRHGSKKYIYPDLMMRMHVMKGINTDYVDYALKAPSSRKFFAKNASGTSDSMPKINQATVRNALIPLPPLPEQKRIVAKLEEFLPLCEGQK